MSRPPVHHATLENGLEILLQPAHAAAVAAVQVFARVGSADETADEAGLAHFHEHMLFKGTERRALGEVAGAVENAGGRINAFTTFDVTAYHATVPSDAWRVALDVLADAVCASTFDAEEVVREREVVLEEIRRSEDSPGRVLSNAVFAEAYTQHPYRAPILGTPDSVGAFDRERVVSFFRRWYGRPNLVVVCAGDFDPDEVQAEIARAFEGAAVAPPARARRAEPEHDAPRTCLLRRHFERATLELAWLTVPFAHEDTPLLDLLALILGQGDSSRLVRRVKERDGLVDSADAYSYTPLDTGLFGVSFDLESDHVAQAVEAAVAEVERLRRQPVTHDELEKARTNFLAMEHFERESVGGLARKLGSFHTLAGDYRAEARYLDAIRSAKASDLLEAARRWLDPSRLTVGALLTESERPHLDDAALLEAVDRGVTRTSRTFRTPGVGATTSDVRSYALACGATLHVVRRDDPPVVAGRAAALGGQLSEHAARAGISSFLASMWLRGTRGRSAGDFARAVESLAADVDGFSGRNSVGGTFECTRDSLEPVLDLFTEMLLEPAFDEAELERERREVLAAIERREDRLAQRVFLLFAETHFQHHPYRLPLSGSADSVRAIDRESLLAHQHRLVRADNLVFGVCGDVDPDELALALGARLADLPSGAYPGPEPSREDPPREIRVAELHKAREQAHLVLGFRGLDVHDPDRYALEVISQILAGQSGRLFLELRDRRSLAYTVMATNVEGVHPGTFSLYIGTAPKKLDAARSGMLEQLERLVQEAPAAEEVEGARRHLVGNFAIDEQRAAVRAAHLALDGLYGLGAASDRHYAERVGDVTPEDVLRVARRVIDLDAYTMAVIKP